MLHDVKIYLPDKIIDDKMFLFGLKEEKNSEKSESKLSNTITTLTVVAESNDNIFHQENLQLLGTFGSYEESIMKNQFSNFSGFNLITDGKNLVTQVLLNGENLPDNYTVYIFYYDKQKFQKVYDEFDKPNADEHFALSIAKCLKNAQKREGGEKSSISSQNLLINFVKKSSKILQVFSPVFKNTAIYQHCSNWRKCLVKDHSRNGFIMLDVMLGILFFLFMSHIQETGRHFMHLTEIIVGKLRSLLEMLDGSPVGLKLNVQLNNFLLSCFMYHVDLWFNFIVIVEPAIHYLFVPITVFGFFGLSFQCALICDIITLITLHAHCFYIYAAMLYKLELTSIRSLLRIVLGRRLNVLKSEANSELFHCEITYLI